MMMIKCPLHRMVKSATSDFSVRIVCIWNSDRCTQCTLQVCNFVKCKCKIQKQHNRSKAESNMLLGYPAMHACNWKETAKKIIITSNDLLLWKVASI